MKMLVKAAVLAVSLVGGAAQAGPFILAGTDADDHGFANASGNQDGWLFMQSALQNLASSASLTTANRTVVALGSNTSALTAAQSAFSFSSLAGLGGWTFVSVPDIAAFSTAQFASTLASAGIVMLDSGSQVGGGRTSAEESVLTANASALNSFVGAGGGLFSQAGTYGWLSALVPGLTVATRELTGLTLTPSGNGAFPGLNNSDLSSGPYHQNFTNLGSIPVLATGLNGTLNVIIGAAGGSIINPDPISPVPEPETYALMLAGLAVIARMTRRRKSA